jgi:ABC-type phosphate/phosphonate transport system substrate-binding protein
VLEGEADAGATFANDGRGGALAGCEETIGAETRNLRVLATSEPIPNDLVAARPGLPPDVLATVRSALLALRGPRAAAFHADGFAPAEDADYAALRR